MEEKDIQTTEPIKTETKVDIKKEVKLIPLKVLSMLFSIALLVLLIIGFVNVASATTAQEFSMAKAFYIAIFILIIGAITGGIAEIFAIIGLIISCVKRKNCLISTRLFFIIMMILPIFIEAGFLLVTMFLSGPTA